MPREIITFCVGEAGINLGDTIWRQYCIEHDLTATGKLARDSAKKKAKKQNLGVFFEHTNDDKLTPRNIMVDSEPDVVEQVRATHCKFYNDNDMVYGSENTGHNFARGHYTVGKEIIDKVNDRLRLAVDRCDNLQGFIVNHSVGGGTGSGIGALILERIAVDYRKKSKQSCTIYPFGNANSDYVVEPYNALLATHWLLDHSELTLVMDNRQIYNLCGRQLRMQQPSMRDMNLLIAKMESGKTHKLRFEPEIHVDVINFQRNIVAFPRLHFIVSSVAPLVTHESITKVLSQPHFSQILVDGFIRRHIGDQNGYLAHADVINIIYSSYSNRYKPVGYYDVNSVSDILAMCCDPDYFSVEFRDFNPVRDRSMHMDLQLFGTKFRASPGAMDNAIQTLKQSKKLRFVEWCPSAIASQWNISDQLQVIHTQTEEYMVAKEGAIAFHNSTAFGKWCQERICKAYDKMYSQRAFVHWYVADGMEEGEFAEAREDLGFLEKDYSDALPS